MPKTYRYACTTPDCDYITRPGTETEVVAKLHDDGGFDEHKQTACPLCKRDSLIFFPVVKEPTSDEDFNSMYPRFS